METSNIRAMDQYNMLNDEELGDVMATGVTYYKRAYRELVKEIGEVGAAQGAQWAANWAMQLRMITVMAMRKMPITGEKGVVQ